VLNITDFRSGRLLHLSDQAELINKQDVVDAAIASAALPLFVNPVRRTPTPATADASTTASGSSSDVSSWSTRPCPRS
jgi:hypothetical protein